MKIRPCRNRMSRFVAAEMRYFHRPFAMSVLSCCTAIIALVSALLSLLSYVGSSSDVGTGSRGYLNISIGLLIAFFSSYIIYIIIKWGRLPSYSLVMSFTAVNYIVSAFGGFLLARSVLYDMLEDSIGGGYEYFLKNILSWSFLPPLVIILLFFAVSFVKSKTGHYDGGWWHVIFIFLPLSIIPFVSFVMRLEIDKEDFVTVTSISVMLYVTIMLSIAARYIVKAVMNKFLTDMPVFEDAVVVKSAYRASDGKRIHWWEKKPPVSGTDETEKEAVAVPVSKMRAFWSRFSAWFKRIFASTAPPDTVEPTVSVSVSAADKKTEKPSKKAAVAPDNSAKSKDGEDKRLEINQNSKETAAETNLEKLENTEQQPDDVEQSDNIKNIDSKAKPKTNKRKSKKQKTNAKAEASTNSDNDKTSTVSGNAEVSSNDELLIPKSPKLSAILTKVRAKNAIDSEKNNAKKADRNIGEEAVFETTPSTDIIASDDEEEPSAEQSPKDTLKLEETENSDDARFAENSEPSDDEPERNEIANGEMPGDESSDSVTEPENVENAETETVAVPADSATTAENEEASAATQQEDNGLLNRVVGALNTAIDNLETQDSEDKKDSEAITDETETESVAQDDSDDEKQPEKNV